MTKVLLAGATGYLGSHIARELRKRDYFCRTIVRNPGKLREMNIQVNEIIAVELTQPATLDHICQNIDVVISTVGITRQKDGLSYMDVDYQANMNLLQQALESGVKKFIYVSVLNGEILKHLKICEAKERFVDQVKKSGLDYCIIRPNGFFSDMAEIFAMAKKGRIYLLGDGKLRSNPIHGEDLAALCIDAMELSTQEIRAGGPETLSHNEIAMMAFDILGKKGKITYIPAWIRLAILKLARLFTKSTIYGPLEFFLTVMAMDMLAPHYGNHTLREYFTLLNEKSAQKS